MSQKRVPTKSSWNSTWPASAVVYQIYPRSFKDSNGDGIGDIQGIIEKLDYLNDGTESSLGINTIWISPFYPSPMVDFGYDIADYCSIEPLFGSLADFDQLVAECKKREIKVVLDYVPNHTSSQHPWFLESKSSTTNPKRDWYIWRDPKPDGSPPNNWLSVFGGSAWAYDQTTKQYYYHAFDQAQPDLNWRNPEVVDAMMNVLQFWLDRGVDGFRVDAVEWLFEVEDLANEPLNPNYHLEKNPDPFHQLLHHHTFALPECNHMIKKMTEVLESRPQKMMVTEVWSPMEELLKMYSSIDRNWFMPFNFSLLLLPWTATDHQSFINSFDQNVGSAYLPTYVLGNHDRPRVMSRIGPEQVRNAAMLLLTLRGIPFIYYGEEIGMENAPITADQVRDPFELNNPGLGLGRDPERTPMQWSSESQAGFTTGQPWLPLHPDYLFQNVEVQRQDPTSLFNLYRKLIHFRNQSPALQVGQYSSLPNTNPDIFAYTRQHQTQTVLIVLNYSHHRQTVSFPFGEGKLVLDTNLSQVSGTMLDCSTITVASDSGLLIELPRSG